jgi:hypothetical protein
MIKFKQIVPLISVSFQQQTFRCLDGWCGVPTPTTRGEAPTPGCIQLEQERMPHQTRESNHRA